MKLPQKKIPLPRAILFDMDGTLTQPILDFPRLKAEMGIGTEPILEALAKMEGARRESALAILERFEEQAAAESTLNPGCRELLEWINQQKLGIALITRNSRRSVRTFLQRHPLPIDILITREDGPFKPSPVPLGKACKSLKVSPGEAWMVGDGRYDVEAGHAAGIATVWISHGRERAFPAEPWIVVADLFELAKLLQECHSDP
ncbi:MAG: HAD family hydrolase [Planctomycetota bacterium]|nr:HAD family hydrolase [Planctomycetota bacterium]